MYVYIYVCRHPEVDRKVNCRSSALYFWFFLGINMCIYICIYIWMNICMYVYIYRESLQQSHSLRAGSPNPFSSMIDPIFHKRFFHSYVKSPAFFMTLHLCFYVYSCVKKHAGDLRCLATRLLKVAPAGAEAQNPCSGVFTLQPFRGVLPPCIYVFGNASARVCHGWMWSWPRGLW